MVFNPIHNESAARLAGTHIIEVGVGPKDGVIILNVVFRVRGIGMFCLCRCHLIGYA